MFLSASDIRVVVIITDRQVGNICITGIITDLQVGNISVVRKHVQVLMTVGIICITGIITDLQVGIICINVVRKDLQVLVIVTKDLQVGMLWIRCVLFDPRHFRCTCQRLVTVDRRLLRVYNIRTRVSGFFLIDFVVYFVHVDLVVNLTSVIL